MNGKFTSTLCPAPHHIKKSRIRDNIYIACFGVRAASALDFEEVDWGGGWGGGGVGGLGGKSKWGFLFHFILSKIAVYDIFN